MTIKYMRWLRSYVGPQRLLQVRTSGFIQNAAGHVLLCLRADVMMWDVPGGTLELGETPSVALIREVAEETGLQVAPMRLLGVYSGPGWDWTYPNGDQAEIVNVFLECTITSGDLSAPNNENLRTGFFPLDRLPALLPRTDRMLADIRADRAGHFD